MEYTYIAPPENVNEGWMGHRVKLFVNSDKRDDFWAFLENYCGPRGEQWRTSKKQERWLWGDPAIELRFKHKKHAMIVKLQWEEDESPMAKTMREMDQLVRSMKVHLPQNQSIGRGIRNSRLTAIKPTSNPLPWTTSPDIQLIDYSGFFPRRQRNELNESERKYAAYLFKDKASEGPSKPVWHVDKCRARGDEIMTTAMIEARLAGSTSLPVLLPVRSGELNEPAADRTSG